MTHELVYPIVPTYFIAWEGESIGYGLNDVNQQTTSGLANFETFTDEAEYVLRLAEFGVDITN
jgi:hypothetical protein